MVCRIPDCLGQYDFDNIVEFAKKRFIDGQTTISLLGQAASMREKEEIALVSLLDVEDDRIRDLELECLYARQCKVLDCRDRLRQMIGDRFIFRQ